MGNNNPDTHGKLTIPEWGEQDRPREKYASRGAAALSNAELIAILLRTGTATASAVDLAKQVLHFCNNQLNQLSEMSLNQLLEINGIGPAKATTLLTAFELGRRVRAEAIQQQKHIHSSLDVVEIMQDKIAHLRHEEFWCIYLNTANGILATEQLGRGGITNTAVDIRIVMQRAVLLGATAIIVSHNHPSGSMRPSNADIKLTQAIQKAAQVLNINFLDHIIVHKSDYYSFSEEGQL